MSQPQKIIHLPKVRMLSRGVRAPAIRITNVKSIKPPDPELVKKQEDNKMRAQGGKNQVLATLSNDDSLKQTCKENVISTSTHTQSAARQTFLQKEIVLRSRNCAHKAYECTLPVVADRLYCARHILDDRTAPYRQCAHVGQHGTRCNLPAPADKEQGLCFEHARAAMYARQRSVAPPPPVTTSETLLNQLQHYVRPERTRTTSCASSVSVVSDPADQEQTSPHSVDPFKEIDARIVNAAVSSALMECVSGSDSDADSVEVADSPPHVSDTEDAPCEELPLWRAGVFTAEEAVREAQTVLVTLRAAYGRQTERLHELLRAARLKYLRALRAEREHYCSISVQAARGPLTVRERRQLRKLKAYAGYHRRHGAEAVLARKLHRRRAKVNEISGRGNPQAGRCSFAEGGVRCPGRALPATKHCLKHILDDPQQVLFAACGDVRGLAPCREPVARLPLPSSSCRYHTGPPVYTTFSLKKEDTDSESESHLSSEISHVEEPEEKRVDALDTNITDEFA